MATTQSTTALCWLSYVVQCVEPVKRSLFQSLTASEVSLVVSLVNYTLSDREGEKWLNPIRDMPEHELWVRQMLEMGHAVTLVGADVSLLLGRINDPIGFWNHYRGMEQLTIWLSVLHRHASMEWSSNNDARRDFATAYEEQTGVASVQSKRLHADNNLRTMFLLPPGRLVEHTVDSNGLDWYQSVQRNRSNLDILFFQSTHPMNWASMVCVQMSSASRWTTGRSTIFTPKLVEEVQTAKSAERSCCVQTTFLNLNSSKRAYSTRCMVMPPNGFESGMLHVVLDMPYVVLREDLPLLMVPVSFRRTNSWWYKT